MGTLLEEMNRIAVDGEAEWIAEGTIVRRGKRMSKQAMNGRSILHEMEKRLFARAKQLLAGERIGQN
jgi:hypothetical protein